MQLEWLAVDFGYNFAANICYSSASTAGHLADALAAQSRLHTLSLGVPSSKDEDSARMLLGAAPTPQRSVTLPQPRRAPPPPPSSPRRWRRWRRTPTPSLCGS